MEEKIIDCTKIKTREDLHRIFRETLSFPDWYGHNLDALYDCLTDIDAPTHLILENWDPVSPAVRGFHAVFEEAEQENPHLIITCLSHS